MTDWPNLVKKYQNAHLQVESFPLVPKSNVWASPFSRYRPYKKAMTDGQTDGHPKPIGPNPKGWGLKTGFILLCILPK